MHLRSLDAASVELRVAGYEFPDYQVHATDVSVAFLRALTLAPQLPTDADPKKLARDWGCQLAPSLRPHHPGGR